MSDPAHHFDKLVQEAFYGFFGDRLPPGLGSETFKTTHSRLRREGFPDFEHAEEVVDRALAKGLEYVHNHGGPGVRQPRAWFHKICHNETTHYLMELAACDSTSMNSLMKGETELRDTSIHGPARVHALLREAIQQLSPRHRELITLDLVKLLPPAEIEKAMGIHSHGYFLKLKSEAFASLREAVKELLDNSLS